MLLCSLLNKSELLMAIVLLVFLLKCLWVLIYYVTSTCIYDIYITPYPQQQKGSLQTDIWPKPLHCLVSRIYRDIAKTKFVTINSIVMLGEESLSWSSTTHWSLFLPLCSYSGCCIHRLSQLNTGIHSPYLIVKSHAVVEVTSGKGHA